MSIGSHKSYVQVAIQVGDHLGLGGVGPCGKVRCKS